MARRAADRGAFVSGGTALGSGPLCTVLRRDKTMSTNSATQRIVTDLEREGVLEISTSLRELLADVFALYIKTKNFHWHMSGRHFRDYHLLLDEHSDQIVAMTGDIAERARKVGGTTIRSIRDIADHQRLKKNDEELVTTRNLI